MRSNSFHRVFGMAAVAYSLAIAGFTLAAPVPAVKGVAIRDEVIVRTTVMVKQFTAMPDGKTVFLLGVEAVDLIEAVNATKPKGAWIDLATKKVIPFTNGLDSAATGITRSADSKRLFSVGSGPDAIIRQFELATAKTTVFADLTANAPDNLAPEMTYLRSKGQLAVVLDESVGLFDKSGVKCFDMTHPDFHETAISNPVVDVDEKHLVCTTFRGNLLVWDLKTKKSLPSIRIKPEAVDYNSWRISDLQFANRSNRLLVCHYPTEKAVPEECSITSVDLEKSTAVTLKMGHTVVSNRMAIHPTDRWIAIVGCSRPVQNLGKEFPPGACVGELRIYDLASLKLVLTQQFAEFYPGWVEFANDGKKIICASHDGEVRSWNFDADPK